MNKCLKFCRINTTKKLKKIVVKVLFVLPTVKTNLSLQMKELALDAINPHLFTVATLTGHAYLTVGPGYSVGKKFSRTTHILFAF